MPGNKTHGHVHQQQSSPRAILPADFRNWRQVWNVQEIVPIRST